jgi:phospholipase D1/2
MRRPAAISQKWRLDRLLQRKAREGVKVFVIMYRNINSAIPIDSEYTKFSLLDLHPNVFVQRSLTNSDCKTHSSGLTMKDLHR